MIQLTRFQTSISLASDELQQLQEQFRNEHCIRLPRLLSPDLLAVVVPRIERARFEPFLHSGIGVDLVMETIPSLWGLRIAANDAAFLRIVAAITASGPFGCFTSRVYRMPAGQADGWHSDWSDNRLVGMSVNLTPEAYTGGHFLLRERADDRILCDVHNTGLGDAIIFRLSESLVHCVSDVTGPVAKTAFAGWFRSAPRFWDSLRRALP